VLNSAARNAIAPKISCRLSKERIPFEYTSDLITLKNLNRVQFRTLRKALVFWGV